ncbi:MAG: hypothetical protein U0T69_10945 [Chitinophagales bacterium]
MENEIWVYINKHYTEEDEITGSLLEFIINDLRWELNYRGDAPLLIYRSNDNKHILQIDGDLFYPVGTDLADLENDDEIYDGYLFQIEEAIKLLNMLLYADLELESDIEENEKADFQPYFLEYDGQQQDAFNNLLYKVKEDQAITKEDIISLK